jgi:hypothetical protein
VGPATSSIGGFIMSYQYPYPVPPSIEEILATHSEIASAPIQLGPNDGFHMAVVLIDKGVVISYERVFTLEDKQVRFYWPRRYNKRPPRAYLVINGINRNGNRFIRRFRLPLLQKSYGAVIVLSSDRTEAQVVTARVATVTLSNKSTRQLPQRSVRPNPEEVTVLGTHFEMRGPNITSLVKLPVLTFRRTWSGSVTPGFGKIKRQRLPVNNHTVDLQTNNDSGYLLTLVDSKVPENSQIFLDPWQWRFGADVPTPPSIAHNGDTRNQSLQRLLSRIDSSMSANLAQNIGQFGQLSSMMNSTVGRLTNMISSLRKKNYPAAISALWKGSSRSPRYRTSSGPNFTGNLANNVLELQYGWKPLLSDIDGAMKSLALFFNQTEQVARVATASAQTENITRGPIENNFNGPYISVGHWENISETRIKFGIRYRIDDRLKRFLGQTGFTNPINLAWEVLPYSFVVDWFLPVGPYLETISAYDGLEMLDGWETKFTRQRYIGVVDFSGVHPSNSDQWLTVSGSYRRERILLNRSRITSFPTANFPSFKNPISFTHAINGLALLRAAWK